MATMAHSRPVTWPLRPTTAGPSAQVTGFADRENRWAALPEDAQREPTCPMRPSRDPGFSCARTRGMVVTCRSRWCPTTRPGPNGSSRPAPRSSPQLAPGFLRLEHIGSTSVPGLAAKPVIDMMATVRRLQDGLAARTALAELGYQLVETGMPDRLFFQRRDSSGASTHHLHVVGEDTWATRNERLLRDHLREHPEQARGYGELKEQLSRDLGSGEAYTRAKTALIQELVDAARDALGLPRVPVWEE